MVVPVEPVDEVLNVTIPNLKAIAPYRVRLVYYYRSTVLSIDTVDESQKCDHFN